MADLRETVEEFGESSDEARELLTGAYETDPEVQRLMAGRRIRQAVRLAAAHTPYYRKWFAESGVDSRTVDLESLRAVAPTPKPALRGAPFAFVSERAEPVLLAQTTGTSGVSTQVWFSRYELEVAAALSALSMMLTGGLRSHHVIASFNSSRAVFTQVNLLSAIALVGAGAVPVGVVDPRIGLDRLAAPVHVPGKHAQVTHVLTASSYLACLVGQAERDGWTAQDFGLHTIFASGEILTDALRRRAERVFGAPVVDTYGATEIVPTGGQVCTQRHLHLSPEQGHVEVLDPMTHATTRPGEVGMLVVTPYALYRDTTLLLRYQTGDLVRRLPDDQPLACELATIPATSRILGRAGTTAGPLARHILDLLQTESEMALPTRYAVTTHGPGLRLVAVAERRGRSLLARLEQHVADRGLPITDIVLVEDPDDLPAPCPVRADLREHTFDPIVRDTPVLTGVSS